MKFTKPLLITKLKATAVHLSMSIAVFVYLAYQIYYNWYPEPYFSIDGGWQGIRLIGAGYIRGSTVCCFKNCKTTLVINVCSGRNTNSTNHCSQLI